MFDNYIAFDPSLLEQSLFGKNSKWTFSKIPSTDKRIWFAGSNLQRMFHLLQKN